MTVNCNIIIIVRQFNLYILFIIKLGGIHHFQPLNKRIYAKGKLYACLKKCEKVDHVTSILIFQSTLYSREEEASKQVLFVCSHRSQNYK